MKKKAAVYQQQSFLPAEKPATMSAEEFKARYRKPRVQHEKKFMDSMHNRALLYGLPSVHIRNYCGNRFNHQCPRCGNVSLVTCNNLLNKHNAGMFDLIGIRWALEFKHKTTKKKKQIARGSFVQQGQGLFYKAYGIPAICANESNINEVTTFFSQIRDGVLKP